MKSKNLTFHNHHITKQMRAKLLEQKPCVLWLTGLSASGKSTIANLLEQNLYSLGINTYLLDGDNIRHGLNSDLGFDNDSRVENIRRIAETSKLFVDSGLLVITAFISPFIQEREMIRNLVEKDEFIEIFVNTPLEVCEQRDPKGLYQKVRQGQIKNFTGIDSPYEVPINPEIILDTTQLNIQECCDKIMNYLKKNKYIKLEELC